MEYIKEIIPETGIIKIISEYKKNLQYAKILEDYNSNWELILEKYMQFNMTDYAAFITYYADIINWEDIIYHLITNDELLGNLDIITFFIDKFNKKELKLITREVYELYTVGDNIYYQLFYYFFNEITKYLDEKVILNYYHYDIYGNIEYSMHTDIKQVIEELDDKLYEMKLSPGVIIEDFKNNIE